MNVGSQTVQALVLYEEKDLDDKYAAVAERAEDIFAKRTKTVGAMQKAKWALYEKKHFETLLNDI
jgi:predicted DNA-binding protein with PD1-like motif